LNAERISNNVQNDILLKNQLSFPEVMTVWTWSDFECSNFTSQNFSAISHDF